jgi:hypothetical protein
MRIMTEEQFDEMETLLRKTDEADARLGMEGCR